MIPAEIAYQILKICMIFLFTHICRIGFKRLVLISLNRVEYASGTLWTHPFNFTRLAHIDTHFWQPYRTHYLRRLSATQGEVKWYELSNEQHFSFFFQENLKKKIENNWMFWTEKILHSNFHFGWDPKKIN